MSADPIYLDYNATTPVDPAVLDAMLPYFTHRFGNAASNTHPFGWAAGEAVAIAREQTAAMIGTTPDQLVFTSGATESLNLAIIGVSQAYATKGKHIVTLATEHKAVLDTCSFLEKSGFEVTLLPVDRMGQPDLELLKKAITPRTILVSAMMVNNETGVILPIKEIAEIVHASGSIFLCDATQACGKIPVNVDETGIDLLAFSAHKFYGPKGTGALFVRRKNPRVSLVPLIHGGGHESGKRSGTLNVPGIVGMGKAAELAVLGLDEQLGKQGAMRLRFERMLVEKAGAVLTTQAHRNSRTPFIFVYLASKQIDSFRYYLN